MRKIGMWLAILYIAIAGGAIGVLGKLALPLFSPMELIAVRIWLSIGFFTVMFFLQGKLGQNLHLVWRQRRLLSVLAFLGVAVAMVLGFMGLQRTTAIQYDILFNLSPVFMAAFSIYFLGERIGKKETATLCIALIGAWMVVMGGRSQQIFRAGDIVGDLLVLVGAAGWGGYSVASAIAKKIESRLDGLIVVYGSFLIAGIFLLPTIVFMQPPKLSGQEIAQATLATILLAIGSTAILFSLWLWFVQKYGGVMASVVGFSENIGGIVFPMMILGESVSLASLMGGMLIIGAIAYQECVGRKIG